MENDNNQTQENRAFKKEDAYETLGIINTWIGNMDTKVSFALALAGVLIGVIFEKGMPSAFERITEVSKLAELSGGEIIAAILVALLYLSSFISILCFMLSIIARVKNLNNASSIFFFGSIGNMTLENYKSAVKDMDEKEMIDDLREIIYVFLTIFLYLLKCPQSLILSALRAFCFCGKPHISRSIFLYFPYQSWLKSW